MAREKLIFKLEKNEKGVGGVWGFKALPLSGAELWPQAVLSAKESSRGVTERRASSLGKKGFLQASQSSNQDAELDVAKRPGGGQGR